MTSTFAYTSNAGIPGTRGALKKAASLLAVIVLLMTTMALPALATSESGHKSCSTDAHVYTKAKWKSYYTSWVDITADGNRENSAWDTNGGVWEIDYLNLYGWGTVVTWVNSAYYYIYGVTLSTSQSWPGCEAD